MMKATYASVLHLTYIKVMFTTYMLSPCHMCVLDASEIHKLAASHFPQDLQQGPGT